MSEPPAPFAFKKRPGGGRGRGQIRARRAAGSSSSEDETTVVKRQRVRDHRNPLVQSTGRRSKLGREGVESDDSSSDDGMVSAFKSKRDAARAAPRDMGATAANEVETEKDKDAQAVYERSLELSKESRGEADDKVYRGISNYAKFYEKKDTAAGNAASGSVRAKGPIRAPDHIRSTVRWDYQPDLCKDYKETGFCGFGDSCKFLHDRTDYKHGWQIELEANKKTNKFGEDSDEENYEIPSDEEYLPFKCLLCRESFVDPVKTICNHYYCEKCALSHHQKKSTKCFVCGVNTKGMFVPATELIARLSQADDEEESS